MLHTLCTKYSTLTGVHTHTHTHSSPRAAEAAFCRCHHTVRAMMLSHAVSFSISFFPFSIWASEKVSVYNFYPSPPFPPWTSTSFHLTARCFPPPPPTASRQLSLQRRMLNCGPAHPSILAAATCECIGIHYSVFFHSALYQSYLWCRNAQSFAPSGVSASSTPPRLYCNIIKYVHTLKHLKKHLHEK